MRYLKWKLSEGTWGTGPEEEINKKYRITVGAYGDSDGYRIGYLSDLDLSDIDAQWDVTEVSAEDALAFAQTTWADAEIDSDGRITQPPSEIPE